MEPQTITRFSAQNIQRLHAVNITPDGDLVIIGGENGQGKSSCLDSIEMALAGKDAIGPMPIHRGESKASIVLETQDLIVTRTFSAKGTNLTVKGKDGRNYSSPQTLLDSLYAAVAFDPLAFSKMKGDKQREELRRLVGLDFSDLETEAAELYEERTEINRQLAAAQAELAKLKTHPDAGEPLDMQTLLEQLRQLNEQKSQRTMLQSALGILESRAVDTEQSLSDAKADLEEAQRNLELAQVAHDEALAARNAKREEVGTVVEVDTAPIEAQLQTVESHNAKIEENAKHAAATKKVEQLNRQSEELTDSLNAIGKQKTERLQGASFPVPGLSLADDGVTMNDIPFEQASAAEKLRVSVAMGIALNPTLRVLLIRNGSDLDKKSLALVGEMASAAKAQVWIERVGDGKEVQVVIEDGNVKEDRTKGAK